jgi:hypothetical protein
MNIRQRGCEASEENLSEVLAILLLLLSHTCNPAKIYSTLVMPEAHNSIVQLIPLTSREQRYVCRELDHKIDGTINKQLYCSSFSSLIRWNDIDNSETSTAWQLEFGGTSYTWMSALHYRKDKPKFGALTHAPPMCPLDVLVSPKSSSQEAKSWHIKVSNSLPISLLIYSI